MNKQKRKEEILRILLFGVGFIIFLGSHIAILFIGLPENQIIAHAWWNIIAGILIGVSIIKF